MARNPELEAILQARYELETCEPSQKTNRRPKLDALLEAALAKAGNQSLAPRALIEITAKPIRNSNWPERGQSVRACLACAESVAAGVTRRRSCPNSPAA